jgi:hypothetical protein
VRSKLAVLAVASVVALAACEQILGVDRYKKCGIDTVCDASDLETGNASDAGDAGSDVLELPDGVSEASSWPHWIVPNTATEVQQGASDASLANYGVTDGGAVDNVTKLIWSTSIGSADSVEGAAAYCTGIGFRLPTRIEIATLLDSTRQAPPYITPTFDAAITAAKLQTGFLWTSSYVRPVGTPLNFWFASLSKGDMIRSIAAPAGVLCVR